MSYEAENPTQPWSRTKVIVYSFIVIPYFIALFGVILYAGMRLVLGPAPSAHSALATISRGSETERWQSALDLVSMLQSTSFEADQQFVDNLIHQYKRSTTERQSYLRTYLALAMGLAGDPQFEEHLIDGLTDIDDANRLAATKALGLLGSELAEAALINQLNDQSLSIVLESVIGLGQIGHADAITALLPMLDHQEANIRWDTAIALLKLGDFTGLEIVNRLLDPGYFAQFPEVDFDEQNKALAVAVAVAHHHPEPLFEANLTALAQADDNLTLANAAIWALKAYSNN